MNFAAYERVSILEQMYYDYRAASPYYKVKNGIELAVASMMDQLTSSGLSDDRALREISKKCKWKPKLKQWIKQQKQALGTDEVSFYWHTLPYRAGFEPTGIDWRTSFRTRDELNQSRLNMLSID